MEKPQLQTIGILPQYVTSYYKRYLPSAYDPSLSIYEQLITVIEHLNQQGKIVGEIALQWNELAKWIMNDGLNEAVRKQLQKWIEDGTLAKIINEEVFNMKADKKHTRTSERVINLSEYDIQVDGTDQSAKLQAIFDTLQGGETIIFPTGKNEQDKLGIADCVKLTANNVKFIKQSGAGYYETRIKGISKCASSTIFSIDAYGFRCEGLVFEGDAQGNYGENATITALKLVRSDGSANVDAKIVDTRFSRLARGIYTKGKNVEVFRCDFDTSIKGVVIEQDTGQETRGHVINSCRFHSMGADSKDPSVADSVCVSVWGQVAYTYKNQIINCYADGIKNFFNGTLTESQIMNNTIPWLRGTFVSVEQGTSNCQIINNQMQDRYNGSGESTSRGIILNNVTGGVIKANQFTGLYGEAISLTKSGRNNIEGNVIIDGNWKNRDGVNGIYVDSTSIYNSIQNNTIDNVTTTLTGYDVAILLEGNENQLGFNFIRGQKINIKDTRTSNRGEFYQYNHRRRTVYVDTYENGVAMIETPNTGDIIKIAQVNQGYPCEYRFQSTAWKMTKQAGVNRNPSINRPVNLTTKDAGLLYLDTGLKPTGKPIWWIGDGWVDAEGNPVV